MLFFSNKTLQEITIGIGHQPNNMAIGHQLIRDEEINH